MIKHLIQYYTNYLKLSSQGVILKKGWLSIKTIEIPLAKINSISINQSIFGRIFGYGDVIILSGNDISGQVFNYAEKPETIKAEILKRVHAK